MITDNRSSEMVSTVEFLIVIIIFFQLNRELIATGEMKEMGSK